MSFSCEIKSFPMKIFYDSCEIPTSERRPYCLIKKGQWPNHVISTQLRGNLSFRASIFHYLLSYALLLSRRDAPSSFYSSFCLYRRDRTSEQLNVNV
jgi:hypothetical protein